MADSQDDPYKKLFEKMAIPRFLIRYESGDFIFDAVNNLALKYFDLDNAQLKDKKLSDILSNENVMHFEQSFEVCIEKKRSVTIQSLPSMPGGIRVYGFYISPLINDDGNVTHLDVIGHLDVADQSILQRERDDAISLLTSIFEVSEIGIVVSDHNRRVVRVNDSFVRTYGWTRDELINADVVDFITPDEREQAYKNHAEFITKGVRSSGEMKLIRKDGSIANALFTTATIELSQKRRFQVTTVMDITLRKQMEVSLRLAKEQADTANRAKSAFLEAGRIELDESEVSMTELIKSVSRMMESRVFGKSLSLHQDIAENLPYIMVDQRLMRQVLINLVTNAVKFSDPGGDIFISAEMLEAGAMQIIVKDNGIGIPKDKLKQAMEPFGQVTDKAENSGQQGTGLGLPLAKAMVELHQGAISLESEEEQGTTVTFRLPSARMLTKAAAAE